MASARLSEALDKLHEVDIILEQLSAFWTNTEVVLDRLTKKGEHVEQFIAFSQKPRLLARFKERMEEYKRFWEGVNQLCKNFTRSGEQPAAAGASGAEGVGPEGTAGTGNHGSERSIYTLDSVNSLNSGMQTMGSSNFTSPSTTLGNSNSSSSTSQGAQDNVFANFQEEQRANARADSLS